MTTTITPAIKERRNAIFEEVMRQGRIWWRDTKGYELVMTQARDKKNNGQRQGGSSYRTEVSFENPRDSLGDVASFILYLENSGLWADEQFPLSIPKKEGKYPVLIIDLSALLTIDRSGYLASVADVRAAKNDSEVKAINLTPRLAAEPGKGFNNGGTKKVENTAAEISPQRPTSFKGLDEKNLYLPPYNR